MDSPTAVRDVPHLRGTPPRPISRPALPNCPLSLPTARTSLSQLADVYLLVARFLLAGPCADAAQVRFRWLLLWLILTSRPIPHHHTFSFSFAFLLSLVLLL